MILDRDNVLGMEIIGMILHPTPKSFPYTRIFFSMSQPGISCVQSSFYSRFIRYGFQWPAGVSFQMIFIPFRPSDNQEPQASPEIDRNQKGSAPL